LSHFKQSDVDLIHRPAFIVKERKIFVFEWEFKLLSDVMQSLLLEGQLGRQWGRKKYRKGRKCGIFVKSSRVRH